jgi:integrase
MAPEDFRWRGKRAGGLPILCERDGAVCEPVTHFFGWSHWIGRVAISSLQKEAYVLREWWAWLDAHGVHWDDASDRLLSDWREAMRERARMKDPRLSEQRIHDKCQVVFTFYDRASAVVGLKKSIVSPTGPISVDESRSRRGGFARGVPARRWLLAENRGRNVTRRKTPDGLLTQKVLTELRNSSSDTDTADRNWLIGRVMAEAGLRRKEVAQLTVPMIESCLSEEGLSVPSGGLADCITPDVQEEILSGLERLRQRQYRQNLWIKVTGKGRVTREAPFPIELIRDLLIFCIWGARSARVADCREAARYVSPPNVFLSSRRGALTGGTIGNLMKEAFTSCGSDLSGHRLRAVFATRMAARLWHDAFAQNGFRWDQTVENLVLDQVARALGHRQVTTTIRHYLSLAQMEYFSAPTKTKLKELREAVSALRELDRPGLTQAAEVLVRLGRAAPGSAYRQALDALNAHPDLQPPPAPPDIPGPGVALRLVPKSS